MWVISSLSNPGMVLVPLRHFQEQIFMSKKWHLFTFPGWAWAWCKRHNFTVPSEGLYSYSWHHFPQSQKYRRCPALDNQTPYLKSFLLQLLHPCSYLDMCHVSNDVINIPRSINAFVAQGSCGCPSLKSIQGQVGWSPEKLDLEWWIGTGIRSLRFLPTQTLLRFCDPMT